MVPSGGATSASLATVVAANKGQIRAPGDRNQELGPEENVGVVNSLFPQVPEHQALPSSSANLAPHPVTPTNLDVGTAVASRLPHPSTFANAVLTQ